MRAGRKAPDERGAARSRSRTPRARSARSRRATAGATTGPLVAITGSNGKTTTKEMCAAILAVSGPCLKNEGNLNNEFGLPLTLLRRGAEHRSVVVELGMNHRGEIARLAAIAQPRVGVITNVGTAHIEHLGSREDIALEKGDLVAALDADATAVLNADDPLVLAQAARTAARVVRFGRGELADVRADDVAADAATAAIASRSRRRQGAIEVSVAGLGETTVPNALAAAAAALAAGVPLADVAAGLRDYRPVAGRLQPIALARRRPADRRHLQRESAVDGGGAAHARARRRERAADRRARRHGRARRVRQRGAPRRGRARGAARHRPAVRGRRSTRARSCRSARAAGHGRERAARRARLGGDGAARARGARAGRPRAREGIALDAHGAHRRSTCAGAPAQETTSECSTTCSSRSRPSSACSTSSATSRSAPARPRSRRCSSRSWSGPPLIRALVAAARRPGDPRGRPRAPGEGRHADDGRPADPALLLVSVFLWSNLDDRGVWILIGLTVGYGMLGFIDDYAKVRKGSSAGVSARAKLFWQTLLAGAVALAIYTQPELRRAPHGAVLQELHALSGLALHPARHVHHRGREQRREPHRRPRRPRDRPRDGRGGHVPDPRLRGRPRA